MAPPALLFSTYRAEVSVDIRLQQHHIPGIGIPAKVVVASVTDNLVVLMVGLLGHQQPLLSLADWRGVPLDLQATSRSVVLHFADIRPTGTLAHFTGGSDNCSFVLRVVLETQAAFWALAFHLSKPLSDPVVIAAAIWSNQPLIRVLLDCFKADDGSEYFEGTPQLYPMIQANEINQTIDEAPPGYTEHKNA